MSVEVQDDICLSFFQHPLCFAYRIQNSSATYEDDIKNHQKSKEMILPAGLLKNISVVEKSSHLNI